MGRVLSLSGDVKTSDRGKIAVIERSAETEYNPSFPTDIQALLENDAYPSLKKFLLFWTMMDTIQVHGYMRAAMGAIGRATIGAWWKLSKHEDWGKLATERQRKRLIRFYSNQQREWNNIKDYQSLAYKLIIGATYLRFFGQTAFMIIRNQAGQPIGFDHLPGLVVPNVDEFGYFKDPAFVQYPTKDPRVRTEFSNPKDIIYIINPDWQGSPLGGSDIEALTEYVLPLDIYLQTAARDYMKNSNRPELIYMLPQDISDEAFDTFVSLLNSKYGGPSNRGKNPVAVQGELKVQRIDDLPDALPFSQSRNETRDETLAVSGTAGSVLGLTGSMASANIREARRQFHETTMEPLFKLMEIGFYEQIHVREFNAPGWMFNFNHPDFLTAVERATVHMRYIQNSVYNPNEVREELGKEPRADSGGDEYVPVSSIGGGTPNNSGSPPEGQPQEPDAPAETGEPTIDDQDPPRGDQHDDTTGESTIRQLKKDNLISEVKEWKRFAIHRMKRGMKIRRFNARYIPFELSKLIQNRLDYAEDVETVKDIFDDLFEAIKEIN